MDALAEQLRIANLIALLSLPRNSQWEPQVNVLRNQAMYALANVTFDQHNQPHARLQPDVAEALGAK